MAADFPILPMSANADDAAMSPPRRRILLAGPLPPPAHGQSLAFEMLCRELRGRDYDCRTVDLARRKASPWSKASATRSIEVLSALKLFAFGLTKSYRLTYIHLTQSRAGFVRDMAMIWSAWFFRCRIIGHLHGGNYDGFYREQSKFWRLLIRLTLRRLQRIIVLSERLRGMYAFDPVLPQKVAVVMNSTPEALKGRPRLVDGGANRVVRLLFLSNLVQSKGYYDVLEAVKILKHTTKMRLEAAFAGVFMPYPDDEQEMSPGEAEATFFDRAETEGLSDVVRYLGPVDGDEKRRLFETCDFFLLPTYNIHEGQPISILEAMAFGCVVIATNYRSIPDMVIDGETGFLVDRRRPDQIADAIRRVAADTETYMAMSRAAVKRYEKFFTVERHLNEMVSILDSS